MHLKHSLQFFKLIVINASQKILCDERSFKIFINACQRILADIGQLKSSCFHRLLSKQLISLAKFDLANVLLEDEPQKLLFSSDVFQPLPEPNPYKFVAVQGRSCRVTKSPL